MVTVSTGGPGRLLLVGVSDPSGQEVTMLVIQAIRWSQHQPEEDREKELVEPLRTWLKLNGVEDCQVRFIPDAVQQQLSRYVGRR